MLPIFRKMNPLARFDILYIDGGHTYEQASTDIDSCIALAREGGFLLIDDITPWVYVLHSRNPYYEERASCSSHTFHNHEISPLNPRVWPDTGAWDRHARGTSVSLVAKSAKSDAFDSGRLRTPLVIPVCHHHTDSSVFVNLAAQPVSHVDGTLPGAEWVGLHEGDMAKLESTMLSKLAGDENNHSVENFKVWAVGQVIPGGYSAHAASQLENRWHFQAMGEGQID